MVASHRRQLWLWLIAAVVAVGLFYFISLWRERAREELRNSSFLTGDPANGARLYEAKGCASCHPLDASPRKGTPDLRSAPEEHASFNALVSAMWNHAPSMWVRMDAVGMKYPDLDEQDVADLFAFLYMFRYSDEPGSSSKGRMVFTEKGCVQCHAIRGEGGQEGPDLALLENADAPIVWMQMMWNHAFHMRERMQRRSLPWPRFEQSEMTDLLAYLRSVNTAQRQVSELLPANVREGRQLFREKGCIQCHALGAEGGKAGPDLARLPRMPRRLSETAGVMWNHWPEMSDWMKHQEMPAPVFEEKQMVNLIAFLYSLRYFDEPGQAHLGRRVYFEKKCDQCHGPDGLGTAEGPNLARRKGGFSVVGLGAAMWRHGPRMYKEMQKQHVTWPKFREREMDDLIAYLNTW